MDSENPPLGYVFSMDRWTPSTIPARRLAQYIEKLAALFDNCSAVHFQKITKGSARPMFTVDAPAAAAVYARVMEAANDDGDESLAIIRRELNKMLKYDNCTGYLQTVAGEKIIEFPGRKTPIGEEVTVYEMGSIDGVVTRIGGRDKTVPLMIQNSDGDYLNCTVDRTLAKQLAPYFLGEEVRLFGNGKWQRSQEGEWSLQEFNAKNFEVLTSGTLTDFVKDMRAIEGSGWNEQEEPHALLKQIRED